MACEACPNFGHHCGFQVIGRVRVSKRACSFTGEWRKKMSLNWSRTLMPAAVFSALVLPVHAQQPQPAPPQQPQAQNPFCPRLEAQLQAFDRGGADGGRADQIRKFEEAAGNQQTELERQEAAARRAGCESNSFFVLFSGQSAQCGPLNNKIKQMRGNLDRIQADIERLRGDPGPERASQRRAIVVALAQNNCGPQYQAQLAATQPAARSGNLLESLFGSKTPPVFSPGEGEVTPGAPVPSGTYRTLCVRTCDGFYYPISTAASPARFAEDEKACRQSCPAAETMLFSHRNPGEDINQAVSVGGQQPYTALPTAFRYRTSLDQTCSCKRAGESWSQALKNIEDTTVEQGDIVVNDQRARQLSQPRLDAQGKPIRQDPRANARPAAVQTAAPQAAPTPPPAAVPEADKALVPEPPSKPDPNRTVRAVGPTFIPGR